MGIENSYSGLDRLLHRLSFSTTAVQIDLAELEERLFAKQVADVAASSPVFITALPRAGTTLLLELCAELDEFATHCYRDMPFVLLPLFWQRFSGGFRKSDKPRERAHGDGMLVSVDSPEAFEEIIWHAMWPAHYQDDRIVPWGVEPQPEFLAYFRNHLRKISAVRRSGQSKTPRYISKNNANICRIDWLSEAFPDARFVIPFRDFAQHAASLLRQHKNFLTIHADDPFARQYMAGICHFDFGANLKPIDFGSWLDGARHRDPASIGFWVEYWAAAYGDLLRRERANLIFLSYDRFCTEPERGLTMLGDFLEIEERDRMAGQAANIRPGRPHEVDLSAVDPAVRQEAAAVQEQLLQKSWL